MREFALCEGVLPAEEKHDLLSGLSLRVGIREPRT